MTEEKADQYDRFRMNMIPHIENGTVIPLRKPSLLVAGMLRVAGSFDMCFIDGAHDYESVCTDINSWAPLTTGLLCGHDYDHADVKRAVTELVPNHTVIEGTTIWMRSQR